MTELFLAHIRELLAYLHDQRIASSEIKGRLFTGYQIFQGNPQSIRDSQGPISRRNPSILFPGAPGAWFYARLGKEPGAFFFRVR